MDISKEYIKMCSKAYWIQDKHKWEKGDYWFNGNSVLLCTMEEKDGYHPFFTTTLGSIVWIPRQDQLQNIFVCKALKFIKENNLRPKAGNYPIHIMIETLYEFYSTFCDDTWPLDFSNTSMEKLWLSLLINFLADKNWDGENWENDKK